MNHTGTIDTVVAIPNHRLLTRVLWISAFTVLTAVGAHVSIPTLPVPITLQTFFVLLSGAMLGSRRGMASQLTYLAAGLAGLPVFANGGGGILHLFGPTGGYLLAFPFASLTIGYLVHEAGILQRIPAFPRALLAMTVGLSIIFILGVTQLQATVFHSWPASIRAGFLALQWWDGLKLLAAASIYAEIARRYRKLG